MTIQWLGWAPDYVGENAARLANTGTNLAQVASSNRGQDIQKAIADKQAELEAERNASYQTQADTALARAVSSEKTAGGEAVNKEMDNFRLMTPFLAKLNSSDRMTFSQKMFPSIYPALIDSSTEGGALLFNLSPSMSDQEKAESQLSNQKAMADYQSGITQGNKPSPLSSMIQSGAQALGGSIGGGIGRMMTGGGLRPPKSSEQMAADTEATTGARLGKEAEFADVPAAGDVASAKLKLGVAYNNYAQASMMGDATQIASAQTLVDEADKSYKKAILDYNKQRVGKSGKGETTEGSYW
jgi:hypothetical protein